MDTNTAWEFLSGLSVGSLVSWIALVGAILGCVSAGAIKLYKFFLKYTELKTKDQVQEEKLNRHEEMLDRINASLEEIKIALEDQKEVTLGQIRSDIVHTCEDALVQGYITPGKLKSVEELYAKYVSIYHGNGYVTTLVKRTRSLPIHGRLDD